MALIHKINKELLFGIKEFFKKRQKTRAVLGLSGGIDSAVTCSLLAQALSPKNVTAVLMPVKGKSQKKHALDAKNYAKELGVNAIFCRLDLLLSPFAKLGWQQPKIAKANLAARIRAAVLYNYANSFGCLVVGTGNRTELKLGYFTKYGDGAADFFPIGGLWKKQVFELAKIRGLPESIIKKEPTAGLWEGQTDEKEIGLKYSVIDEILEKKFDHAKSWGEIISSGCKKEDVLRVKSLVLKNRHKALLPPVLKITYT